MRTVASYAIATSVLDETTPVFVTRVCGTLSRKLRHVRRSRMLPQVSLTKLPVNCFKLAIQHSRCAPRALNSRLRGRQRKKDKGIQKEEISSERNRIYSEVPAK